VKSGSAAVVDDKSRWSASEIDLDLDQNFLP
jgi:hypothetical protein